MESVSCPWGLLHENRSLDFVGDENDSLGTGRAQFPIGNGKRLVAPVVPARSDDADSGGSDRLVEPFDEPCARAAHLEPGERRLQTVSCTAAQPCRILPPAHAQLLNHLAHVLAPNQATIGEGVGDLADLDGPFLLLATDASRFMTGATIPVDGGRHLTCLR